MSGGDDTQAFKDFEAAGWSANAPRYGALTGRITARFADALLDAAPVRPGTPVPHPGRGARRAIALWHPPRRFESLGLPDGGREAAHVTPPLAFPPGPPAYRFSDESELRALLEGAALRDVRIETVDLTYEIDDVD